MGAVALGLLQEIDRRRRLSLAACQRQGTRQLEEEQGAAAPLILARHHAIQSVIVKSMQQLLGNGLVLPGIVLIPPRNHRSHVQIFRQHPLLDLVHGAMDVQVSRPPAFLFEIGETLHADLFGVGVVSL